jgi:hypothetical protein
MAVTVAGHALHAGREAARIPGMDDSPFDAPTPDEAETRVMPSDEGGETPSAIGARLAFAVAVLAGLGLIGFAVYRIVIDEEEGSATPVTTTTMVVGDGFVTIEDETGRISVDVPEAWDDVNGSIWVEDDGTEVGPALTAAEDIESWVSGWGTAGVFIHINDQTTATPGEVLDSIDVSAECTLESRDPYDRGDVVGELETYVDCGPEGSTFVQMAATRPEGGPLVLVQMVLLGDTSVGARVLNSWQAG